MQLANIAALMYRHPMSTHFLRAVFHHFLNVLLKSGCRFKVAQTNRHCYSPLRKLCKQYNQRMVNLAYLGILSVYRSMSHTDLNALSPGTLILFKNLLYTVHKTQHTIHFDKIDKILKVSIITFRSISNLKHMLNLHYACKLRCMLSNSKCLFFDIDFIAKKNTFLQTGSS